MTGVEYVCPSCGGELDRSEEGWRCREEGVAFGMCDGIPDFILPGRRPVIESFLAGYQRVRRLEGWSDGTDDYYRDLPYRDRTGLRSGIWKIRARTFDAFLGLISREAGVSRVLDLGAGNGWLSMNLAERGYGVCAVDINLDPQDGLGVLRRTTAGREVKPMRAEYDALPFAPGSFDAAVFNASLHYSPHVLQTLARAVEVVKAGGAVYILDSPLYRDPASGKAMVREREEEFERRYHVAPATERGEGFLTFEQVGKMQEVYSVELVRPWYGLRWKLRRAAARIRGRREAAEFAVIVIRGN